MELFDIIINYLPRLINFLINEYPVIATYTILILSIPGFLTTAISLWVKLTPSTEDNQWWNKKRNGKLKPLFDFLDRFSLVLKPFSKNI